MDDPPCPLLENLRHELWSIVNGLKRDHMPLWDHLQSTGKTSKPSSFLSYLYQAMLLRLMPAVHRLFSRFESSCKVRLFRLDGLLPSRELTEAEMVQVQALAKKEGVRFGLKPLKVDSSWLKMPLDTSRMASNLAKSWYHLERYGQLKDLVRFGNGQVMQRHPTLRYLFIDLTNAARNTQAMDVDTKAAVEMDDLCHKNDCRDSHVDSYIGSVLAKTPAWSSKTDVDHSKLLKMLMGRESDRFPLNPVTDRSLVAFSDGYVHLGTQRVYRLGIEEDMVELEKHMQHTGRVGTRRGFPNSPLPPGPCGKTIRELQIPETPLWDKIHEMQLKPEEDGQGEWKDKKETMAYIEGTMYGKLNFPISGLEHWELYCCLIGDSGCGKSCVLILIQQWFHPSDIGNIDESKEKMFGLEKFLQKPKKLLVTNTDMTKGFSAVLSATQLQKMASGETLTIPGKFQTAQDTVWDLPMLFVGNHPMGHDDPYGALLRRQLVLWFRRSIPDDQQDTTLKGKIVKEAPYVLLRCVRHYHRLRAEWKGSSPHAHMPPVFKEWEAAHITSSSWITKFIDQGDKYHRVERRPGTGILVAVLENTVRNHQKYLNKNSGPGEQVSAPSTQSIRAACQRQGYNIRDFKVCKNNGRNNEKRCVTHMCRPNVSCDPRCEWSASRCQCQPERDARGKKKDMRNTVRNWVDDLHIEPINQLL
jgi:hypothetical protein